MCSKRDDYVSSRKCGCNACLTERGVVMEPVIEPQPALTSSEEEQTEDVEYTAQEIEELPRRCTCKNLYHSSFTQCMLRAEQDSPFCDLCYSDDCN